MMAPIFATADIAAIVAAHPPASPTRQHPSLIPTLSSNDFVSSEQVLGNFRTILETSPDRIRLSDLPRRLGIQKTQWLLDCHDGPILFSRDGKSALSAAEVRRASDQLFSILEARPSMTADLIAKLDVSSDTLDQLAGASNHNGDLAYSYYEGGKRYLYSCHFVNKLTDVVNRACSNEDAEGVDLTIEFPGVPKLLLKQLGDAALNESAGPKGTFEPREDRIQYIPAQYAAGLEAKRKAAYEQTVREIVDQVQNEGFCRVPRDTVQLGSGQTLNEGEATLLRDVKASLDGGFIKTIHEAEIHQDNMLMLVLDDQLQQAMTSLRAIAPQEAARAWYNRDGNESSSALKQLAVMSMEEQLSMEVPLLLLKSRYLAEIEPLITDKFAKLEHEDFARFAQLFTDRVLAPVQLYADGIATIMDTGLKQHLEEYIGNHFRREVIPSSVSHLREQKLLVEKSRRRETEKVQQACSEAKTLADIQSSLTKLARKQKITLPDDETISRVKRETLQTKAKGLRKMNRGSDVLQNLIWILLATSGEGLFMSSGKDTTRMLRQFRVVGGDEETSSRLEGWRDALKRGESGPEILEDMRRCAEQAVNRSE